MRKNIFMSARFCPAAICFPAVLCFFSGVFLVSCSSGFEDRLCEAFGFSERELVSFVLPELENCSEWNVSVRFGTGFYEFIVCSEKEKADGSDFSLSLEKNVPCSVKAVPVLNDDFPSGKEISFSEENDLSFAEENSSSEENTLPSGEESVLAEEDISTEENNPPVFGKNPLVYGLVYPFVSEFSLLHGFSADILCEFYTNAEESGNSDETMKDFISRFNWKKFCSALENNRNADENYNPWLLDRKKILKAIESRKFSASLLKV